MAIAKWQDFFAPNSQDIDKGNYLVFETDRQFDPSKKLAIKALEKFAEKIKDQNALIYITPCELKFGFATF